MTVSLMTARNGWARGRGCREPAYARPDLFWWHGATLSPLTWLRDGVLFGPGGALRGTPQLPSLAILPINGQHVQRVMEEANSFPS
jgi:hypothetical protein